MATVTIPNRPATTGEERPAWSARFTPSQVRRMAEEDHTAGVMVSTILLSIVGFGLFGMLLTMFLGWLISR